MKEEKEEKRKKGGKLSGFNVEEYIIAILMAAMCISILLATISRYTSLFVMQLIWCEEFARFCMIYVCFLGAAVAVTRGSHFAMEAVVVATHGNVRKALVLIDYALTFIFLVFIVYFGAKQVIGVFNTGKVSTVMGVPMWIVFLALPIGSIDMAVRTGILFIKKIKNINVEEKGGEAA